MRSRSRIDAWVLGGGAVVVCGLFARVAFLAADPAYPFWSGWVADEGRWVKSARDLVLFGDLSIDRALARTHLILAPVYQALTAMVFWLFGVGTVSLRLLSVVSGLGILLVSGLFLGRRLPFGVALGGVALLAVQPDLVYFGRVAIPEMTALFFEVSAFTLLVGRPRTTRRAFFGGVATAVALGVKGTTAPVALAFTAVVLLVHRPTDPASRLRRVAAFLSAILIPGIAFMALATVRLSGGGGVTDILGFADLNDAYGVVATLFHGGWTVRVNLILMAVWGLGLVGYLRQSPDSEARMIFVGSSIWVAAWMVPWALLLYFPERYVMHIHVPLILALVSGYALLVDDSARSLEEGLEAQGGFGRMLLAVALAVPAAVVSAPFVLSVIDMAGPALDNLRFHVVAIAVLAAGFGVLLRSRWRAPWVVALALVYPLLAGLLWVTGEATGLVSEPFWAIDGARTGSVWLLVLGVSASAAVALVRGDITGARRARRVLAAFTIGVAALWAGQGVVKLQQRTFVQREVADFLMANYPASEVIGSKGASSLLVPTPFEYYEAIDEMEWPDVVVVYFADVHADQMEDYRIVREFELDIGPGFTDTYRSFHVIRVYEIR